MKKLTVFLILNLLAFTAQAQMMTGNTLYGFLQSTEANQRSFGLGFVTGVFDTLEKYNHCAPVNVTSGQIRDMVKQFLENGPAIRDLPANEIILALLNDTWPCDTDAKPSAYKTT